MSKDKIKPIKEAQQVEERGLDCPIIRPMNSIEKEVVSKINEIVERFNEVFPL